jgi:hypothetical protein
MGTDSWIESLGWHFECNSILLFLCRYLRLELLEGVVAYHSGQFDKSRKFLASAQEKFFQVKHFFPCVRVCRHDIVSVNILFKYIMFSHLG